MDSPKTETTPSTAMSKRPAATTAPVRSDMGALYQRWGLGLSLLMFVPAPTAAAGATRQSPKYYFQVHEVKADGQVSDAVIDLAREALAAEIRSRPELTLELKAPDGSDAADDVAVTAALKKRRLKGYRVSLRLERVARQVKDPRPGGRLKRVEVAVKLSIFGSTIPDEKLAFGGEGEAATEAEAGDRAIDSEAMSMTGDVIKAALKQAVDQAVAKLALPTSAPIRETKRKKRG